MTKTKNGELIGYIRVCTLDLNTLKHSEQLEGLQLNDSFTEITSSNSSVRPQLHAAFLRCSKGDTLVIHSFGRLARNLEDLQNIILGLIQKGVSVQFIKENIIFSGRKNSTSIQMLSFLKSFADFEMELISERQREEDALAIGKKVHADRTELKEEVVAEILAKDIANKGKGRSELAKEYNIARETLYKYLKAAEAPSHWQKEKTKTTLMKL